jgi:hypothetical protein
VSSQSASSTSAQALVCVDYNAGGATAVSLGTPATRWDFERLGVRIAEGLRLRAYDPGSAGAGREWGEMTVCEGVVVRLRTPDHSPKFDWLLRIERGGRVSDLAEDPTHWVHGIDWDDEERIRQEWQDQHPERLYRGYTAADE